MLNLVKKIIGCKSDSDDGGSKVVCGCFNVTEQDLINAIKKGAKSFEEVQAITKVGTGCGLCVDGNRELVS